MIIIENKVKVLIADDEFTIRNGLREAVIWEDLNMEVVGLAEDGEEAYKMINKFNPDIVITDIRMPIIDGIELIKKTTSMNKKIQFIILSGYDDFSYAQKAIRFGVKAYFLKPLRLPELIEELKICYDNVMLSKDNEHKKTNMEMELFKEDSKKLFLNHLIENNVMTYENIKNKIETLKISINYEPVQVLVFEYIGTEAEQFKNNYKDIIKIINDVFFDIKKEVWVYNQHQIVVIINSNNNFSVKWVYEYCKKCFEKFHNIEEKDIIVGIGDIEEDLERSYYSYTKALSALTYKLYETSTQIYDSKIICSEKPAISANNVDVNPLVEFIRKGEEDKISKYCKDFFNLLFYVPMPPPSYIKGMCIYLVSDVQKTMKSSYKIVMDQVNINLPFTDLGHITTLKLMEKYMVEYFYNLSRWIKNDMLMQQDSIIAEAKDYIQCNLKNKISASEVANHVNLSVAYFTVYFKTKAGINFRDYLIGEKMEYAKKLLVTSNLSISEVGSSVGYDDYRSFYRAFKNHTGQTPSEFVGNR